MPPNQHDQACTFVRAFKPLLWVEGAWMRHEEVEALYVLMHRAGVPDGVTDLIIKVVAPWTKAAHLAFHHGMWCTLRRTRIAFHGVLGLPEVLWAYQ